MPAGTAIRSVGTRLPVVANPCDGFAHKNIVKGSLVSGAEHHIIGPDDRIFFFSKVAVSLAQMSGADDVHVVFRPPAMM